MTTATTDDNGGRNRRGQFTTGNRYASGNPVAKRLSELRRLVETAITDDDVQQVVQALVSSARKGDTQSAAVVLAYAVGKPRPAPVDVDLDLPALTDAKAVAEALRAVTAAVAGGALDLEAAQAVAGLVTTTATAVQWADLERRVAAIEAGR